MHVYKVKEIDRADGSFPTRHRGWFAWRASVTISRDASLRKVEGGCETSQSRSDSLGA